MCVLFWKIELCQKRFFIFRSMFLYRSEFRALKMGVDSQKHYKTLNYNLEALTQDLTFDSIIKYGMFYNIFQTVFFTHKLFALTPCVHIEGGNFVLATKLSSREISHFSIRQYSKVGAQNKFSIDLMRVQMQLCVKTI